MLINCVLVLKYSQSTVFHYLHQLLWGGMADVTKYKKSGKCWRSNCSFLWKKETPPHVFTTRLRHRITPWGESERPRGRTTGKYVKNILLAYFSLRLWHSIFSHILDVRKKHGFVLCRMEKLHQRKWRREYSEIWFWWLHDILLGRELSEKPSSRWNEGWSCVFLSEFWFFLVKHIFTLPWLGDVCTLSLLQIIVIKIGWRWWWCREVALCWDLGVRLWLMRDPTFDIISGW